VKLGKGEAGETKWWTILHEVVEKLKAHFEHWSGDLRGTCRPLITKGWYCVFFFSDFLIRVLMLGLFFVKFCWFMCLGAVYLKLFYFQCCLFCCLWVSITLLVCPPWYVTVTVLSMWCGPSFLIIVGVLVC